MKLKIKKVKSKLQSKGKLIGAISIFTALAIAIIFYGATAMTINDAVEVVRAKTDIVQGKAITDDDIELIKVSKYNLASNVITDKENVVGKFASVNMKTGDYIFTSKLSKTAMGTDTQLANLKDGQVAISFSVDSLAAGLSNKLQGGDVIRLYSYDSQTGVQEHPNLLYVSVLSVSDSTGAEANKDASTTTAYATITISATPEQAKDVIHLENMGTIYVSFLTRNMETATQLLAKQVSTLN